jgi:hypothetical protein
MTEYIKQINQKINEYYENIKLSCSSQDNFNLDIFIKEISNLFNKKPKTDS